MKRHMRRRAKLPLPGLALLLTPLFAGPPAARADIDAEVKAVLQERVMRNASLGVEVVRLGAAPADAREVYGHEAAAPKVPASNLKLATTSAALDHFGAGFKFRTVLFKHGDDLVLVGDGDPTFGDAEYLRRVGWQVTTVFQGWAQQLKKMNVAAVGDVVVDDSVFDTEFFHPQLAGGPRPDEQGLHGPGVGHEPERQRGGRGPAIDFGRRRATFALEPATDYVSVALNRCVTGTENAVSVTRQKGTNALSLTGQVPGRGGARVSATIDDPPLYAATVLSETMAAAGVKVGGKVRRDRTARQERVRAGAGGRGRLGGGRHPRDADRRRAGPGQ